MQNPWYSFSVLIKTIVVCIVTELLLLALLWSFVGSWFVSAIWQILLFGPPTVFLAPWLYKRFKVQAQSSNSALKNASLVRGTAQERTTP